MTVKIKVIRETDKKTNKQLCKMNNFLAHNLKSNLGFQELKISSNQKHFLGE